MADALLLPRVLQNLLDNSLKYMKDEQKPKTGVKLPDTVYQSAAS